MAHVQFTRNLTHFFPTLAAGDVPGETVGEVMAALEKKYPGLGSYLLDDAGGLRKHVNVFLDEQMIRDRVQLSDPVAATSRIYIAQALSGG